jgi:LacI family transcriptional regulator
MERSAPPSQSDVARMAGVSRTTVSFVLNDVPDVSISDETRERVWEAVVKLGFRPNAMARGLRSRQSNVLGLITDDIAITPYAVAIVKGAQEAAFALGKTLLIVDIDLSDADAAADALDVLMGWRIDGAILATAHHRAVEPPGNLDSIPCVLVHCYDPARRLRSVVPDEVQGGRLATETLLAAGHRRIAFINGPKDFPASAGRLRGYREALAAAGVGGDPRLIRVGDWWQESGYLHTRELVALDEPPTALFCANDWMAMGAYDALKEAGLGIPADMAVIGFDNRVEIAAHMRPPLTTGALPYYEMGAWAARSLVESDDPHADTAPPQLTLPCELIERGSV